MESGNFVFLRIFLVLGPSLPPLFLPPPKMAETKTLSLSFNSITKSPCKASRFFFKKSGILYMLKKKERECEYSATTWKADEEKKKKTFTTRQISFCWWVRHCHDCTSIKYSHFSRKMLNWKGPFRVFSGVANFRNVVKGRGPWMFFHFVPTVFRIKFFQQSSIRTTTSTTTVDIVHDGQQTWNGPHKRTNGLSISFRQSVEKKMCFEKKIKKQAVNCSPPPTIWFLFNEQHAIFVVPKLNRRHIDAFSLIDFRFQCKHVFVEQHL